MEVPILLFILCYQISINVTGDIVTVESQTRQDYLLKKKKKLKVLSPDQTSIKIFFILLTLLKRFCLKCIINLEF